MDHHQAIEAQLPERYVFGDLVPGERDEFEEHLADCSRCLEELTLAQAFASNAQAVFREQAYEAAEVAKETRTSWWRSSLAYAFSGGLNVALAGVALYAFLAVIPALQSKLQTLQAPAVATSFVIQGATRGPQATFIVQRGSMASFQLDLPHQFDRYLLSIDMSSGETQKTYTLHVPDKTETLNVTVPSMGLATGDHKTTLRGLQGTESELLAEFVIRITDGK